tara:strand:+ start:518 stop:889 length:372 start_codon:yes stop_codon:yes gene_type:complete
MAITYTWDCRTVDVYPTASDAETPPVTETDVVYNVHWRLTGEEVVSGSSYSATNIGTQVVSTENFSDYTTFGDLTNAQATSWVTGSMEAAMTGSVQALYDGVADQIALQITPTSITMQISGSV